MRLVSLVVCLAAAGCSNSKPAQAPQATPPPAAAAAAAPSAPRVAKVVFIDKEHACECTQKAIDASWGALQTALQGAAVPVERIHMDTQEAFAAGYQDKRPMMAVPGLYLLAEDGSIVDLLQGEVGAEKIREALAR